MPFFNWLQWLRSGSRRRVQIHRKRKPVTRRFLRLEELEDRTVLSAIPAALVSDPGTITVAPVLPNGSPPGNTPVTGYNPAIAQDPVNALNMVEVNTDGVVLIANYSTDGGHSWVGMINTNYLNQGGAANAITTANLTEPDLNPPGTNAPFKTYAHADHATVAIDRAENIWISLVEHNDANNAGAVVLHRYSFSGGTPAAVALDNIIYQWSDPTGAANAEAALNPVVGVDNNYAAGSYAVVTGIPQNPGTGYNAGDVLTISGGTFTTPAQVTVTSTKAVGAVTNATGTGYKVGDVLDVQGGTAATSAQLTVNSVQANGAVTTVASGTGYKPGDNLTVQGGTFTTPAQLQVQDVKAVAVTSVA